MTGALRHIIFRCLMAVAAAVMTSCAVHEFPDPTTPRPFMLHLDFDTALPLHKEVEYSSRTNLYSPTSTRAEEYDIRYTVEVYQRAGQTIAAKPVQRHVITRSDISDPDHDIEFRLPEGDYRFIVWADHVDAYSCEDKFYDTSDFNDIRLRGDHSGSNDMRDAFRGHVDTTVDVLNQLEATVEMERPLAKYTFIATDLREFITRIQALIAQKQAAAEAAGAAPASPTDTRINLDDYRVVFRYTGFMPNSYSLFTMKPADAATGVFFDSSLEQINSDSATLGFDYVFVNGSEGSVAVAVELYDNEGERLSRSRTIEVPLMRSRHTVVKGHFLSQEASGSVGINPGYDGSFDIEIK